MKNFLFHPAQANIVLESPSYTVEEGGGSLNVCAVIVFEGPPVTLDCDVTVNITGDSGNKGSKKVTTDDACII